MKATLFGLFSSICMGFTMSTLIREGADAILIILLALSALLLGIRLGLLSNE